MKINTSKNLHDKKKYKIIFIKYIILKKIRVKLYLTKIKTTQYLSNINYIKKYYFMTQFYSSLSRISRSYL